MLLLTTVLLCYYHRYATITLLLLPLLQTQPTPSVRLGGESTADDAVHVIRTVEQVRW